MTQPKFTPGPWSLCHHLQSVESDNACPCGYRGVVYGPCGDARAICQPGHEPAPKGEEGTEPERYPRETEIANAHLIASAPDLYGALGALGAMPSGYCFCSRNRDPDKDTHEPECRDARAALAKAIGEDA